MAAPSLNVLLRDLRALGLLDEVRNGERGVLARVAPDMTAHDDRYSGCRIVLKSDERQRISAREALADPPSCAKCAPDLAKAAVPRTVKVLLTAHTSAASASRAARRAAQMRSTSIARHLRDLRVNAEDVSKLADTHPEAVALVLAELADAQAALGGALVSPDGRNVALARVHEELVGRSKVVLNRSQSLSDSLLPASLAAASAS